MIPLRLVILIMTVWMSAEAQRSFYAPRPHNKLLPRFREQTDNETSAEEGLVNREKEEEENSSNAVEEPIPPELQGTLEDKKFVQRVSQWPEDRQPFWFKNRQAISSMRNTEMSGSPTGQQLGTRVNSNFPTPFNGNRQTLSNSNQNGNQDTGREGQAIPQNNQGFFEGTQFTQRRFNPSFPSLF